MNPLRHEKIGAALVAEYGKHVDLLNHIVQMYTDFSQAIAKLVRVFNVLMEEFEQCISTPGRATDFIPFTNWVYQFFANVQGFISIKETYEKEIEEPLHNYQRDFSKYVSRVSDRIEIATNNLRSSQNEYERVYREYENQCKETERLGKEPVDDLQLQLRMQSRLDEERNKCYLLEQKAIESCKLLGFSVTYFTLDMETIISEYETTMRTFYEEIAKYISAFASVVSSMSKSYTVVVEAATSELEKVLSSVEIRTEGGVARKVSRVVTEFSQLPPLDIDIFAYLPWSIVFQTELQSTYYTLTEDFNSEFLTLSAGENVRQIKEKKGEIYVEDLKSSMRVFISKSILDVNKTYKPDVMKITAEHEIEEGSFLEGQYVLVLSSTEETSVCRDLFGNVGEVPKSKLELAEENKC